MLTYKINFLNYQSVKVFIFKFLGMSPGGLSNTDFCELFLDPCTVLTAKKAQGCSCVVAA